MMEIKLFDYQEDMKSRIERALCLHHSVMAQMPTGTGKTVLLASVVESFLREHPGQAVWIVAHRRELVSQIKETLNKFLLNFNFPTTPSSIVFTTPSVPLVGDRNLHKEGSTSFPKPFSPQGTRDVAGYAIASPEFLYRQRSFRPQGADDDFSTQQSYHDDFRLHSAKDKQAYHCSRLHENCDCLSASALRLSPEFLGGVNRFGNNLAAVFSGESADSSLFPLRSSLIKVVSIQWLSRHYDEIEEKPGMIVIDEAHHALAKTYKGLWERFPKTCFLGLTATPCRLNGKGFTDLFEVLVRSWDIPRFIQEKRLATYDFVSIKADGVTQRLIDSLQKRGADGDYQNKEMDMLLNKRPSIRRLFQSFADFAKDRKGIVYAINISHARKIAEFYREHGVVAVAIDSKTPSSLRKELIERFKLSSISSNHSIPLSRDGIFPITPSLLHKEGSTFSPSPSSSGSGDVAGYAIASPEFLYRQRSFRPQGADDDFSTQQSCDFLCGVNRLDANVATNISENVVDDGISPIQVLVNVDIFSEGFDCPDVEFVQLARPTLSLAKYLQMVGRGLRVAKEKKSCVIIDNVGLYRVFGLPSQTWDWDAMFEGRMGRKELHDAVVASMQSMTCAIPGKDGDANRETDSEMTVVMSHDQLERTFELQRENKGVVKERERLLNGDMGRVEFVGRQLVRLTKAGGRRMAYVDLVNMKFVSSWACPDTEVPRVVKVGGVEFVKHHRYLHSRTRSEFSISYSKGCVEDMGFYSRSVVSNGFRMCRVLEEDISHLGGHCVIFLHDEPTEYYWLSGELRDGSLVVKSESDDYFWVERGKPKVYVGCVGSYDEECRMKERLSEIVRLTNLRASETVEDASDSSSDLEPCQIGRKWGLRGNDGRVVIPPIYRKVRKENGFFVFEQLVSHWGVMDARGKVVVQPEYDKVRVTAEGLAVLSNIMGKTQTVKLER